MNMIKGRTYVSLIGKDERGQALWDGFGNEVVEINV